MWGGVRMVVDRLIPLPGAETEARRVARTLPCRGWTALRRSKLRITELRARAETPEGFAFRMSISSSDHTVMPENIENDELVEAAEAVVAESADSIEADATQAEQADTDSAVDADDDADAEPTVTFGDLGLPEGIVRKLAQNGVTAPFPIQAATIPDALAGKDILGRGRTGSGKTLSFGLPTLATLAGGHTEKKKPRAVILTPTRELAMQVADALQPYGDVLGLKMKVVCGGTSMGNQIYALERGVDILVATPGGCATSSTGAPAPWRTSRSLSSTRPTRCPTWASCPRSPSCSTRFRSAVSACSSPPRWRTRSARWSSAT